MNGLMMTFTLAFFCLNQATGQMNQIKSARIEEIIEGMASRKSDLIGYRIQLCFDSDKSIVEFNKIKVLGMFPRLDVYITFEAPAFKLMAGDFRRQVDAEVIKEALIGKFPLTIIQRTEIKLPRID